MSQPFVAQITMFGFNFAPRGWALCQGQLLPISQNTALFSLLGTYYGGDGRATFGLQNMGGRAAVNQGNGAGLSSYYLGEEQGSTDVAVTYGEMALHTHPVVGATVDGGTLNVAGTMFAKAFGGGKQDTYTGNYLSTTAPNTSLSGGAVGPSGGNLPHNNMQPYNTVNFCIAMQGIYPARP
jgi:microcystin-dependent protein